MSPAPKYNDIVIDNDAMAQLSNPRQAEFRLLFQWLAEKGILTVSRKLVLEYGRGNDRALTLINLLSRDGRYHLVRNEEIESFTADRHFKYTCNGKDIPHARLTFLSSRKRLVTLDLRLAADVNRFKKVDKIQPCACGAPKGCCLD